jgi:23S rRNA pseudouridine1911/1915/1917 synthase
VHRLDKPTSGLLLISKTKPSMIDLSRQFKDRIIKKTYVAIVNGIPQEPKETSISSEGAFELGVDVDPTSDEKWQVIDRALDEKSAVTIWRALKYARSLKADDNCLTLVELKPKTGRYHQLRRHMAWVCERPIVGDSDYDGGGPAMQLRERGLFLCSNRVTLQHPFFNSEQGRPIFDDMSEEEKFAGGILWLSEDGKVMVTAEIDIPSKFESFMAHEDERYEKLTKDVE